MSTNLPSYPELKNLTDREILMLVVEKLRSVSENQCNHLRHHHTYSIALLTITGGAIVSLIIALLSLLIAMKI